MASASAYCKGMAAAKQAVSRTWPGTCAVQNKGAVYQPPANGQVEAGQSDITFTSGQDTIDDFCKAKSYSDLTFSEGDCNKAMGIAINNCRFPPPCPEHNILLRLFNHDVLTGSHPEGGTNTVNTKYGGKASINCMMYSILAAPFGNGYPCSYLNVQNCNYGWISPCKAPS